MKKISTNFALLILFAFPFLSLAQNSFTEPIMNNGEFPIIKNDAVHPCITPAQYQMLDKQVAENLKLLKLDNVKRKSILTTSLNWPLQKASGFTDCSYYIVTAYVDENLSAGSIGDYNCGSNTYDTHQGTDICIWPFPFYKMDHSQVEVIAAAPGTIIAKDDGHFDRHCASNTDTANYVIIQHGDGSCALYWHMKSGSVTSKAIGQTVTFGEYLGVVGSSGSSTGPHLHFEVWTGTTSSTYNDPYYGTCNVLNGATWWASQKPYTEPAVLKASVHTTNAVIPGCDTTETPNESTTYTIPFQGQGLPAGAAKFYVFIRNEIPSTTVNMSILNPGGSTFNSWVYNCNNSYNGCYFAWTKTLPTTTGTYTFNATYNGVTCSQPFDIFNSVHINYVNDLMQIQVYPNPASDLINISGQNIGNGNCKINLKNIIGQIILNDNLKIENNTVNKTISISALPCGIYFLTMETDKSRVVKKIIIQN